MRIQLAFLCLYLLAGELGNCEDKLKFFYGMPLEEKSVRDWVAKNRRSKRSITTKLSERVVGGIAAEENKFPWIVYFHAISKKKRNGSDEYGSVTNFCGGSLIHPR